MGGVIVEGGFLLLLFKFIPKDFLDSRFNVNVAVGGFFVAVVIVWLGFGVILSVLVFFEINSNCL